MAHADNVCRCMKRIQIGFRTFFAVVLLGACALTADAASEMPGVAVVELFTSEGCSSCPPAEALLNELDKRAHDEALPVFALAFHVDYWNDLGWKDRFSKREYSRRQRQYAARLRERVYTPQMIVNGQDVFVGSNRAQAERAVREATETPSGATTLALETTYSDAAGDNRLVHAIVTGDVPDDYHVVFALVEHGLTSDVQRGENKGRRLVHRAVVRSLVAGGAVSPVKADLPVPSDANPSNLEVVVFVQHKTKLNIIGAAKAKILSK